MRGVPRGHPERPTAPTRLPPLRSLEIAARVRPFPFLLFIFRFNGRKKEKTGKIGLRFGKGPVAILSRILRKGEVFAYVGRNQNLKDLQEPFALEGWILEILCCDPKGSRAFLRILSTEGQPCGGETGCGRPKSHLLLCGRSRRRTRSERVGERGARDDEGALRAFGRVCDGDVSEQSIL